MKRLILFSMACLVVTETQAQTDSIRTESLPEIVVNADGQIEAAEKTVLLPTVSVWSSRMKRPACFVSISYGSVKTVSRVSWRS